MTVICRLLTLVLAAMLTATSAFAVSVQHVSPTGKDVPPGRQITVEFDRPVVALGQFDKLPANLLVDIIPQLECRWRWLSQTTLSCELAERDAMHPATNYRLTVSGNFLALDGSTLEQPFQAKFLTERPIIKNAYFSRWLAPGVPQFQVFFSQPVQADSIAAHVYFQQGNQRIPVEVVPLPKNNQPTDEESDEPLVNVWQVRATQSLPAASVSELRVEPGLQSLAGPALGGEQRALAHVTAFPAFGLTGINCVNAATDKMVTLPIDHLKDIECLPERTIDLIFSTPFTTANLNRKVTFAPLIENWKPDGSEEDALRALGSQDITKFGFRVSLTAPLKSGTEWSVKIDPTGLQDVFGRRFEGPTQLLFRTAHRQPKLIFQYQTAVLESGIANDLPLYPTNLEQVLLRFNRRSASGLEVGKDQSVPLPKAADIAWKTPLGIASMLNANSGALWGQLAKTVPEVQPEGLGYRDHNFFVVVSPWQIHAKMGYENSLLWVTEFATGKPVAGAHVRLLRDTRANLGAKGSTLAEATTDAQGIAELPGLASGLWAPSDVSAWRDEDARLMAEVSRADQLALLPLDSSFDVPIYQEGIYPQHRPRYGHMRSWGFTPQGIYKLGDLIDYKLYVRDHDNLQFKAPPKGSFQLEICDAKGDVVHREENIQLDDFGSFNGKFRVPKSASVGWYQFTLSANFTKWRANPLQVLVADFTPAPFRVKVDRNGERFTSGDKLQVAVSAALHGGGPYTQAESRINAWVNPEPLQFTHPDAKGFTFANTRNNQWQEIEVLSKSGALNDKGEWQDAGALPDVPIYNGKLVIEGAVRDERGKWVSQYHNADYLSRDRFIGIDQRHEWKTGQAATLRWLVVDAHGQAIAGQPAQVRIEMQRIKVSRVKSAGNVYLTDYIHEWKPITHCDATSTTTPGTCTFIPKDTGSYRITAEVHDTRGRTHRTISEAYVSGRDYVTWEEPGVGRINLVPQADHWQIGQTARITIENPFPGATALITTERYGILNHEVRTLKNSLETLEIPLTAEHAPGFYLSVLVQSPRVQAPPGNGDVDLGKPTYRIGYLRVDVTDPQKAIPVEVSAAKLDYRPRENVDISLHSSADKPVRFAVVAVDEALLDLIKDGTHRYDPQQGFDGLDPLDVGNYSLMTQLVGMQHFAAKGASPGGDGGAAGRTLMQTLAYWNPSLKADKNGNASVHFQLPDNLTGWHILAVTDDGQNRFGLGELALKVSQPTELRPALPNRVLQGDTFIARFTLLNRTDHARDLRVHLNATTAQKTLTEHDETVHLAAYAKADLEIPIEAIAAGVIALHADARDNEDSDTLSVSVPVGTTLLTQTQTLYGSLAAAGQQDIPVELPAAARERGAQLSTTLTPSRVGDLTGLVAFMREYRYDCWEQQISRALVAALWGERFGWKDSHDFVQGVLDAMPDFQASNGGIGYWGAQDQYVSPYLSAFTELALNHLKEQGYRVAKDPEQKLQTYLKQLLTEKFSNGDYDSTEQADTRALIADALIRAKIISAPEVLRIKEHLPQLSQFGQIELLNALRHLAVQDSAIDTLEQQLLNHTNRTPGRIQLDGVSQQDTWALIHDSPVRNQCAAVSAWAYPQSPLLDEWTEGAQALKMKRGDWGNTHDNAWCALAMADYAHVAEATSPPSKLDISFNGKKAGQVDFKTRDDAPAVFSTTLPTGTDAAHVQINNGGNTAAPFSVRLQYEDHQPESAVSGFTLDRHYAVWRNGQWQPLGNSLHIKQGELLKVELKMSAPSGRYHVVVDDPIPGGLEPVNRDLATASAHDANIVEEESTVGLYQIVSKSAQNTTLLPSNWFYNRELKHTSARFFAERVAGGRYLLRYTAQAIAKGQFALPPAKVEEMYRAENYGTSSAQTLIVE